MKLADLVPYENNARHNDKAVPVVAESIKQFGFKGAIVLNRESEGGTPEHPVIVNGHTRVKAMLSLGWTEIPDECIRYTDGLSEEEVKALRLADNRTGEVATWDKTKLQHEVANIKALDMSRFKFDFKSGKNGFKRGQERLRTDRAYNLDLVSADDCDGRGMPTLAPVNVSPKDLQGFNYAKSTPSKNKRGFGCHFFIDDYQFERCWSDPLLMVERLRPYECVLGPDFSLYMDMPEPVMRWNVYRSRALLQIWQREGLCVVPTLTWAGPSSYSFCFDGIPRGGTVATSTVGVLNDEDASDWWREGMFEALREVRPSRLLLYGGGMEDFDFGGCKVVRYKAGGLHGRQGR